MWQILNGRSTKHFIIDWKNKCIIIYIYTYINNFVLKIKRQKQRFCYIYGSSRCDQTRWLHIIYLSEGHASERVNRLWLYMCFISQSFSLSYLPSENFYVPTMDVRVGLPLFLSYYGVYNIICVSCSFKTKEDVLDFKCLWCIHYIYIYYTI